MLEKELENIVLKEKNIIPFLKKLTPKDKKQLAPFLKKFHKKITGKEEVKEKFLGEYFSYSYVNTYSEKKIDLVNKACFVCLNKTDVKRAIFNISTLAISDDYLKNIIPWYVPKWYSAVINEDIPWDLSYPKMMALSADGFIVCSKEMIVEKLSTAIIERHLIDQKYITRYTRDVLERYPETLNEHIWYLFEEESSINHTFYQPQDYDAEHDVWTETILKLVHKNKLDRAKVLTATIYTATKGFNKTLSGWFFSLLIKLEPTNEEILGLQDGLFAALNSPHSKVVNAVLKYFKKVATHETFHSEAFIDNSSILINAETKSVVTSTLMILDKIARKHPKSSISVCLKAAEALIFMDEKVQLRAAKIIEKYGDPKETGLQDEVNMYTDSLFHESREVLKHYLLQEEVLEHVGDVEEFKVLSEENRLPIYESLDELIFFVSQSIDNNEAYHLDLLLSYLPKLNALLNEENVGKLAPIFKRSFELSTTFEGWNSQIGRLEMMAAKYINDFASILMKKFPEQLQHFKETRASKISELKKDGYLQSFYQNRFKPLEDYTPPDYIYKIHHSLMKKSKNLLKKGLTLDLLSTPTHSPCWIDPIILIERIISYEIQQEAINLYDFQIAIGRLPKDIFPQNIESSIHSIKDREIKAVLSYHFGLEDIKKKNISKPGLWLQSVLLRNNQQEITFFQNFLSNDLQKEMGDYDWICSLNTYPSKVYSYSKRKYIPTTLRKKELKLQKFHKGKSELESFFTNITNFFTQKQGGSEMNSLYDYMHVKKREYFTHIHPNDDIKFLYLSPSNPSPFLSQVLHYHLKESTFSGETEKKVMVNLLHGLYETWHRIDYGEITYLFLATGLLCSHKVARELAAEVWIKANTQNQMDNAQLGRILGKLQAGEYAPHKRFTDLLTTSLFGLSSRYNEALFVLLDQMIGQMDDKPIRGLNKMLEVFLKLKHSTSNLAITEETRAKILKWSETKALKAKALKLL